MSTLDYEPFRSPLSRFVVQLDGRGRGRRRRRELLHDARLSDWWMKRQRGRIVEEDLIIVLLPRACLRWRVTGAGQTSLGDPQ